MVSHASEILHRIILERMRGKTESEIADKQSGFLKIAENMSTDSLIVRIMMRSTRAQPATHSVCSIDFKESLIRPLISVLDPIRVRVIFEFNQPNRSTQPGHPSLGSCNEYQYDDAACFFHRIALHFIFSCIALFCRTVHYCLFSFLILAFWLQVQQK